MAIIKPIKELIINDFNDFCNQFNISSNKIAGDDGCDEELIEKELSKIENQNWLLNFINDRNDGYFILQLLL